MMWVSATYVILLRMTALTLMTAAAALKDAADIPWIPSGIKRHVPRKWPANAAIPTDSGSCSKAHARRNTIKKPRKMRGYIAHVLYM